MKFLAQDNLNNFVAALQKDYDVCFPVKKGEHRFYQKYSDSLDGIMLGEVRAVEPLKAFFFRSREVVADDFKPAVPHAHDRPLAVLGVKACDLKGFKVQDHVFQNNDYRDPFYINNREKNLIISSDCTCAIATCFCLAVDVKPFPQRDFDINLAAVNGGFLVETGSKKGGKIIRDNVSLFTEATQQQLGEREEIKKKVSAEVEENIKENDVPKQESFSGIIEKNYEAQLWLEKARDCVECGACNTVCPTCHCFLLYDQKDEKKMQRLRMWDSCMIKDFARVAGGANPRPHIWERLRNRFEKKFDYFPKVAEVYACTGCGRCISACPAKIDIRDVLKRLVKNA